MIQSLPADRSLEEKKARARELLQQGQLPVCALSAGQQALWFLQQQSPDSPAYNEGAVIRLPRNTDLTILRSALEGLLGKHSVLRTIYKEKNGQPYGCIKSASHLDFSVLNAEDWSEETRQRRMTEAHNQPFQLDRDPVVRLFSYLCEPYLYVQVIVHHIACDGWSLSILLRDMLAMYEQMEKGEKVVGKNGPGYERFVAYEKDYLNKKGKEASAYWRQLLAGCQAVLHLSDERYEEVQGHGVERFSMALTKERTERLSEKIGVSPFNIWLALFQVAVAQYTGQNEVLVGTPFMNRELSEFKEVVGFFANTILVRSSVEDVAFEEHTKLLARQVGASKQWGALPFHQVVSENRDVLGDAAQGLPPYFSYRPTYEKVASSLDYNFEETPVREQSPFDLYVELVQEEGEVKGLIHYNKKFYRPDFILRLAQQLHVLADTFFSNPSASIGTAPFTTKEEDKQISEWSRGKVKDYDVEGGYALQFSKRAQSHPDVVAVSDTIASWTYQQLDQWSDGVAAELQKKGVQKDDVVAVYMERSMLLTGTILAIWKAGGIYLPLDPNFPAERIDFILDHAGACLMVVNETAARINTVLPHLSVGYSIPKTKSVIPVSLGVHDGAYLLYTSGSTGRPKGVLVEQGGMLNHLHSKVEDLGLDATSVVAQTATQNFDISIWQLLAALLAGGQVVIIPRPVVMDVEKLLQALEEKKITGLQMVPAYLHLVMTHLETEEPELKLENLHWLVTAGEELKPALANRWMKRFPHTFLLNGFGPTEASDNITVHIMRKSVAASKVPVGKPLANLQVFIVNNYGQWCPPGMKGEICISGIALARGYWKDEEKTAQAFIHPSFSNTSDRLYKTGDLGYWNEDGTIAFCGRKDGQIKIRGHRIEPGEIEQVLQQHPDVQQAAIRYWSEFQGGALAAYIVWKKEGNTDLLRDYLKQWLPSYMMPSVWMELDALPLLPNGKIARQQLPFPSGKKESYTPPVTVTQEILCRIWQEVIGIQRVGIHEDFFNAGGHSLLMTRISNQVKKELGVEIPIPTLFQLTDIESLARFIDFHRAVQYQPAGLYEEIEL